MRWTENLDAIARRTRKREIMDSLGCLPVGDQIQIAAEILNRIGIDGIAMMTFRAALDPAALEAFKEDSWDWLLE